MSDTISKLRDLLLARSKSWQLSGLLNPEQRQSSPTWNGMLGGLAGAPVDMPYKGVEMTPERVKAALSTLLDMTPVVGDAKSAYEGVQAAREGDWAGAGLGMLGALPFVPGIGGWTVHKMGDIKILENPTREMVKNLANKSRYEEVRGLVDPNNGKQYWWDAGSLNHKDVSDWFGIDWDAIEKGSDQTRKMMRSTAIDGTPWKFSGE